MLRKIVSLVALLPLTAASAAAQSSLVARKPHVKAKAPLFAPKPTERTARLVVKFHQGTGVELAGAGLGVRSGYPKITNPYVPRLTRSQVLADLATVSTLARSVGGSVATLAAETRSQLDAWRAAGEARRRREMADLSLYFQVVLPDWGLGRELATVVAGLNRLPAVEIAYTEPLAWPLLDEIAGPPQPGPYDCSPDDFTEVAPDFEGEQGYLSPAPLGVDAAAAWAVPGGRGAGIRVIDIEGGYREHIDLPPLLYNVGHSADEHREHGRKVVGLITARNNGIGTTGIASDAQVGFRSLFNANVYDDWQEASSSSFNSANHIYWAAKHSLTGVVLVELQREGPSDNGCLCGPPCRSIPLEFWPADYDTIESAVANGVAVIEAAANGGQNLDRPIYEGLFDRNVRDSGAILTTGSEATTRAPMCSLGRPNSGSRVDLHSWGELVVTTGQHQFSNFFEDTWCNIYVENFNGSSSASAILAGVAASVQGVALANLGVQLDPLTLRQLLVDTGTPQAPGPNGELIGPQPNLAAAIEELLP